MGKLGGVIALSRPSRSGTRATLFGVARRGNAKSRAANRDAHRARRSDPLLASTYLTFLWLRKTWPTNSPLSEAQMLQPVSTVDSHQG
ncbi:uncharacterized protein K452DRAFT_10939 [Aplosporella prunicola CBS 121167]|uniref:Uncharacterized protein n=1 Tax=Aplosporella prunicola CBS 121167 TaxID=1176127 RepID=A0A6A6BH81_9PEZI|nr:uncharacterized protein K452DRAFT_10939 [Aplosporella prunicola CBS 121167]KAF2142803.1 hypothetical protein K452DRAFT_10939 [Aplosporella prunicola CBS 121167]